MVNCQFEFDSDKGREGSTKRQVRRGGARNDQTTNQEGVPEGAAKAPGLSTNYLQPPFDGWLVVSILERTTKTRMYVRGTVVTITSRQRYFTLEKHVTTNKKKEISRERVFVFFGRRTPQT